jgi:hypothetical protein
MRFALFPDNNLKVIKGIGEGLAMHQNPSVALRHLPYFAGEAIGGAHGSPYNIGGVPQRGEGVIC